MSISRILVFVNRVFCKIKINSILISTSDIFKRASKNDEGLLLPILEVVLNLIKFKVDHNNFEDIWEERLRLKCENLSTDWGINSTNQEFARYLAEIAIVMDVACCIGLG